MFDRTLEGLLSLVYLNVSQEDEITVLRNSLNN